MVLILTQRVTGNWKQDIAITVRTTLIRISFLPLENSFSFQLTHLFSFSDIIKEFGILIFETELGGQRNILKIPILNVKMQRHLFI